MPFGVFSISPTRGHWWIALEIYPLPHLLTYQLTLRQDRNQVIYYHNEMLQAALFVKNSAKLLMLFSKVDNIQQ